MRVPVEKPAEVLVVSSDIEKDPMALEKIAERVVEDIVKKIAASQKVMSPQTSTGTVILETSEDPLAEEIQSQGLNAADVLCGQVIPLLRYFDSKLEKYAGTTTRSYVELVRNKTRAKMAATSAEPTKERQLQETEAKYKVLWKRLVEEVELRRYSEKTSEDLCEYIEVTMCATANLRDTLEASRVELEAQPPRACPGARARGHAHGHASFAFSIRGMPSRVVFNVESQRVHEPTTALERKEQVHAAELAAKIKTQKWLQLRDLERCAIAMIACSVSGQRQLARKLDVFLQVRARQC
ncbi:hypothetical protein AXG93_1981s1000 [Marchantia polymorpha subsp. ruderalis]|uniref:Uncharacterized protein n=1 Tax=Marchantia polymorpha subsp. ruderalis TaxID=1480154 RepID=A0A176W947_MARPO|nr:hypothetical protein AXG93_1981s1000 [Marchantia polymorpha subsp. ruderalis]